MASCLYLYRRPGPDHPGLAAGHLSVSQPLVARPLVEPRVRPSVVVAAAVVVSPAVQLALLAVFPDHDLRAVAVARSVVAVPLAVAARLVVFPDRDSRVVAVAPLVAVAPPVFPDRG